MDDTKQPLTIDAIADRAIARLGDRGRDVRVQQVLRDAIDQAYTTGRATAWLEIRDVEYVAKALNVTTGRVRQLARQHGIGERFGRDWMFRDADVLALRELPDRRRR